MGKILIVEDDQSMGAVLLEGIKYEGHSAALAPDGEAALQLARDMNPDLILLDVMLPKVNGIDVCRRIRSQRADVAIIMLTSRGQELEKVVGLKSGADDYVTKPFSFTELMARVQALLRRTQRYRNGEQCYESGGLWIDFRACEARKQGQPLALSPREFRLLEYFVAHRGEVVERDQLLDAVWSYNVPQMLTRTVDMHIAKLRQKIEDKPNDPQRIVTVHRLGYKFVG
jgi:DNA-binding response OmpR family regulator